MDFLPDEKTKCHRTGFEKRCRDMVVDCGCRLWVRVTGTDPQTGQPVDHWGCADAWAPRLQIDNTITVAREARQTAAAVESLRNEMVRIAHNPTRVIAVADMPEPLKKLTK